MNAEEAIAIITGAEVMVLNRDQDKFEAAVNRAILALHLERQRHNPKPLSFADKIRAMSDEELVTFFNRLIAIDDSSELYCKRKQECCDLIDSEDGIPPEWCAQCLLEYLRQPAEEGFLCG